MTTSGSESSNTQVVVACVCKNEMDRYLPNLLQGWATFADKIVILDDSSNQNHYSALERALETLPIATTLATSEAFEALWGAESPLRQQLWRLALREASKGDWIFILDADMIPANNPSALFQEHVQEETHPSSNAIAFPLYDLWGLAPLVFRTDRFWQGHTHARVWAVRATDEPGEGWQWSERGVHTGHFPINYPITSAIIAPARMGLLHLAYADAEDREAKHRSYLSLSEQLNPTEIEHAQSITDPDPNLRPLPFGTDFGRWLCKTRSSGFEVAPEESQGACAASGD